MNQHVPKKFEGFEPEATDSNVEEVHDCSNCLSYQSGTIVCRCDECNDDCVAWDPIPNKEAL